MCAKVIVVPVDFCEKLGRNMLSNVLKKFSD